MTEHLDRAMSALREGPEVVQQALIGASTSQTCAFALASGYDHFLPEPYDSPGRGWLRLDERQRAAVRRWHPSGANYAEQLAHDALAQGFANHGGKLAPERFIT